MAKHSLGGTWFPAPPYRPKKSRARKGLAGHLPRHAHNERVQTPWPRGRRFFGGK